MGGKRPNTPSFDDWPKEIAALLRRIELLESRIAEQDLIIKAQREQIEKLESELAKARKTSRTSSKPPSSDIASPKKANRSKGKRKKGGQPGHRKHERKPFGDDEIDERLDYALDHCPDCGGELGETDAPPHVIQQIEIPDKSFKVTEHRGHAYWCSRCEKIHYAALPLEVKKGGLAGPRLTALVAYLKGGTHASFSTIRKYLRDSMGIKISRGQLVKIVQKVSKALDAAYAELLAQLPSERVLNIDETGHKENGERFWTWCFRAKAFAFFKISGSRGSEVLFEVLGKEFDGVIGCDYFSAYRKYMRGSHALVQFCLAHLIRDLKFLTTLKSPDAQAYGQRILDRLKELFNLIRNRHALKERDFLEALSRMRDEIIEAGTTRVPLVREAQNLAKRFRKHGRAYFEFITTPGIDPTNNVAEQAIRFVVIDRLVTQGTRSERGREWSERIWTVMATCARQGRSAFDYLVAATQAYFEGAPAPSLLPAPP